MQTIRYWKVDIETACEVTPDSREGLRPTIRRIGFGTICLAFLLGLAPVGSAPVTIAVCESDFAREGEPIHLENGRIVRILVVDGTPSLPGCVARSLPVSLNSIRWTGLVESGNLGPPPQRLALQGEFLEEVRVSEVGYREESPPPSLPLPAPSTPPSSEPRTHLRSAWLWAPLLWREAPYRVLHIAEAERIDRLYLTIPVGEDGVENRPALEEFVREATQVGLEIWPVVGDPHDVLDSSLDALIARTEAYLRYNESASDQSDLSGLQLDIEPHLLPGFALAPGYWSERYLSTVLAVQRRIESRLPLDLVLPVWWAVHPEMGIELLEALAVPGLSLTVMNYRTSEDGLRIGARPFLAWGEKVGAKVSIALEVGSIGPDEVRRSYELAENGGTELLVVDVGEHRVLVVLDEPVEVPGLPGYRRTRESPAPASAITFSGDLSRLETTAALLEPEWKRWPSYDGLAIHGLEEINSPSFEETP